jgi:hypothetical protein
MCQLGAASLCIKPSAVALRAMADGARALKVYLEISTMEGSLMKKGLFKAFFH